MKTLFDFIQQTRRVLLPSLMAATLLLASCKKLVEVQVPITQLTAKEIFASEATANAALANLYSVSQTWFGGGIGSMSYLGLQLADETVSYSTSANTLQLTSNQLLPSNTTSYTLWQSFYQTIYRANIMLEALENNEQLSQAFKKQLQGEAYFFRAYAHLELTMLYGKVPLVLSSDYRSNNLIRQSESQAVLAAVAADLSKAKALLLEDYSVSATERIRPHSYAASALLARTHLYQNDYQGAIRESTRVISNTSSYGLTSLSEAFLKNSKEAILQVKSVSPTFNTMEGNLLILTARPSVMAISPALVNSFSPLDARKTSWLGKLTIGSDTYYYPFKYKVKTSTTMSEYSSMLRLAEQHLIRSEAHAQLQAFPQALTDLNLVRNRAALPLVSLDQPGLDQATLLELILAERRFELFGEWAHRWIDLRRTGRIDQVMGYKLTWKSTAALLPIPQADLNINYLLQQNPGY